MLGDRPPSNLGRDGWRHTAPASPIAETTSLDYQFVRSSLPLSVITDNLFCVREEFSLFYRFGCFAFVSCFPVYTL